MGAWIVPVCPLFVICGKTKRNTKRNTILLRRKKIATVMDLLGLFVIVCPIGAVSKVA